MTTLRAALTRRSARRRAMPITFASMQAMVFILTVIIRRAAIRGRATAAIQRTTHISTALRRTVSHIITTLTPAGGTAHAAARRTAHMRAAPATMTGRIRNVACGNCRGKAKPRDKRNR